MRSDEGGVEALGRTLHPLMHRMLRRNLVRRIQILPQHIDPLLQIHEKHIGITPRSPRVTSYPRMPIIVLKLLLLGPDTISIDPRDTIKSRRVGRIPEMYTDRLVCIIASIVLPRNRTVFVFDIGVKAAVPTGLQADVGVGHGAEVQLGERAGRPDVGFVAVDYFGNGALGVDVEDVPLGHGQ